MKRALPQAMAASSFLEGTAGFDPAVAQAPPLIWCLGEDWRRHTPPTYTDTC